MELIFLCVNIVMLMVVLGFGGALIWKWKSKYSIKSQIISLSLAILLVIGSIVQTILAAMLDKCIILAILEIGIWVLNVVTLSIYLKRSLRIMKINKKND